MYKQAHEVSLGRQGFADLLGQAEIHGHAGKEGWKLVTLLRLSPIIPWNVLNYALSVTGLFPIYGSMRRLCMIKKHPCTDFPNLFSLSLNPTAMSDLGQKLSWTIYWIPPSDLQELDEA